MNNYNKTKITIMPTKYYFISLLICGTIVAGGTRLSKNWIPEIEQVQEGFIPPSELEIKCKNYDDIKGKEIILKIKDKNYYLKEINEKPVLTKINDSLYIKR